MTTATTVMLSQWHSTSHPPQCSPHTATTKRIGRSSFGEIGHSIDGPSHFHCNHHDPQRAPQPQEPEASVSSGMAGIETFGTMETPFHLSIKQTTSSGLNASMNSGGSTDPVSGPLTPVRSGGGQMYNRGTPLSLHAAGVPRETRGLSSCMPSCLASPSPRTVCDVTCLPVIVSPFDWYRVQTPKIPALPLGLHTFSELLELPTTGMLPA